MDIYHYHPFTGEYVGASQAIPDPLEPGRFLIPAHATEMEPPAAGDHEVAVFNGSAWTLMPDFRGTEYWLEDGSKHAISAIGDVVPEGASLTEPEKDQEENLAQAARAKRNALLRESDWVALRATETQTPIPQEWLDYRAALRDVPQQAGFPDNIDWPEAPAH